MITITHNAGFFSCCSVKLGEIVNYINIHKKIPDSVDSSKQFDMYKKKDNKNDDVTYDYFERYTNILDTEIHVPINYNYNKQFDIYSDLDYISLTPLIKKYFTPSIKINNIIDNMKQKYNLIYNNTLAVYYRGTDKHRETQLANFDDFYSKILEITHINSNIKILIQTDTAQFIDYINSKNLDNIIIMDENKTSYTNEGIHNIQTSDDSNYYHIFDFLPIVIIISQCKYIICSSGNCSIWMMLYRGNGKDVIQYLNGNWYNSVI